MFSQAYYLLRSKIDGQYLAARLKTVETRQEVDSNFILVFKEDYDALSYLSTHAPEVASQFGLESAMGSQLTGIMQRWGYKGIGMVEDPIEPRIQFVNYLN